MKIEARWFPYVLDFRFPARTSRDELLHRKTWFIQLKDEEGRFGLGECAMLKGLSVDDRSGYEGMLDQVCKEPKAYLQDLSLLSEWPSIRFGLEMALADLEAPEPFVLFPSDFTSSKTSIPINGLVWMGDAPTMKKRVEEKLEQGFDCIKLKIGALNQREEFDILHDLRQRFSPEELELRVDANGAYHEGNVWSVLEELDKLHVHSIEQPIKSGQWKLMQELCAGSPVAIALDEELIGITDAGVQEEMISFIKPQYLILKPTLIGGFKASQRWIDLAGRYGTGFWVTSALESNVGLNAIAQWTFTLGSGMKQGLGTGALYHNNFPSPLEVSKGYLDYRKDLEWQVEIPGMNG